MDFDSTLQGKIKPLILLVEDSQTNREQLGNLLKVSYLVDVATNGKQALAKIDKRKPDLILLDVMLPVLDGYKVCEMLKNDSDTSSIPVIFITAKTDTEDILKAFKMGAADYVTKPFNSAELLARVRTQLELKRSKELIRKLTNKLESLNISIDDIDLPLSFPENYKLP
jgi:PleD family two-component response regulator